MSMKVRFSSTKETRPTIDEGLKVLYAPARRQAFKWRWYLILLLVATPFIFFAFKVAYNILIVEVPAQVLFPLSEVRASDAGQVVSVRVKEGQTVSPGQLLVEIDNREWRLRLQQLRELAALHSDRSIARGETVAEVLDIQLTRAEERLALVSRLVKQGAATQGELMAAASARDRVLLERLMYEQQETRMVAQADTAREVSQYDVERQWLESRLEELNLKATAEGVVTEILVFDGENVGPGTPVLRLRSADQAQIYAYIDLDQARHAEAGQKLCLRLPDGEIIRATISRPPQSAESVPTDIRAAFSAQRRDLLVTLTPEEPLPARWLIQNLPLQARFQCGWLLDRLW